jgi:hypothetical protein
MGYQKEIFLGDLWRSSGYHGRSCLDIVWDIIWRSQGDLCRRCQGYVRILVGYLRDIYLGDVIGYLMDMLVG